MTETIFDYCGFKIEPIDKETYTTKLREFLRNGIPATITTKDQELANQQQQGAEEPVDGGDTGTTPLHTICESLAPSPSEHELETAHAMIDTLFEYGANWIMLDDNNDSPGCIAARRQLPDSIYQKFIQAGVRAEVFLNKMTEEVELEREPDAAVDQDTYLQTDLEYSDTSLITRDNKDGVMMAWEEPIMRRSARVITPKGKDSVVLNVGFGMGIIDLILQEAEPKHHYISEAHPKVLAKMKQDGWYDKPNVTILEGRWQDTIPTLISQGVYCDGIYYDTFSEHYKDLIEFCDFVVGLLSMDGTFSYFNGLGADRQIVNDVYCQVAELEMSEYGLEVKFESMQIKDDSNEQIRHKYWALSEYKLPIANFMGM